MNGKERRIRKLEVRTLEIIQSKKIQKKMYIHTHIHKWNLGYLWNNKKKKSNVCAIRVLDGEKKEVDTGKVP